MNATSKSKPAPKLTAKQFLAELTALRSKPPADNGRFFWDEGAENKILGVRHATIFALAKKYASLSLSEIDKILDNVYYEARLGAVSILDFQARNKKISPEVRKKLFDLYLRRHDRINNWDLVDRSAPSVVGGYLADRSRAPLYKLAKSKHTWERRTAIVATWHFIRQRDTGDTFKIAGMLVKDKHELIQKAVGSWLREAGKRDPNVLLSFLETHAAVMPRVMLRFAVEKLDKNTKQRLMKM